MTQLEYEQKKRECWEEFTTISPLYKSFNFAFDRAYALGKQETKQETDAEETVISGWVARDADGNMFMYCTKPERDENLQMWMGRYANCGIRNDLFPDLTWDDDPQEVEIIIKRKKNGNNSTDNRI